MSLHTQLMRGLLALPVAGLLIVAGAVSSIEATPVEATPIEATPAIAVAHAEAHAVRTVDFHSMIPGALHVLRKVQVPIGNG
jgi:hypothetical protein